MNATGMTRRGFGAALGAAAGAAVLQRGLAPRTAEASIAVGQPADSIQLNSNENPYGPSAAAREAAVRSLDVAGRYPDSQEDELRATVARAHGVAPEQVLLGCGSGDILRMAAGAFLSHDSNLVVAEPTYEAVLFYKPRDRSARGQGATGQRPSGTTSRGWAATCDAATGLVYVCNPNNPTGTIVSGKQVAAFLARVPASATVPPRRGPTTTSSRTPGTAAASISSPPTRTWS
jgi:histidinol-phosphate aminotransferase